MGELWYGGRVRDATICLKRGVSGLMAECSVEGVREGLEPTCCMGGALRAVAGWYT